MIDPSFIASGIVVSSVPETVGFVAASVNNDLRVMHADVQFFSVIAGVGEIDISSNTFTVLLASWNRKLLAESSESVLDAGDHNWRAAVTTAPLHYIWKHEVGLNRIRLHPIPAISGLLHLVVLVPPEVATNWSRVYAALEITKRLAARDMTLGRVGIDETLSKLMEKISEPYRLSDLRSSRR